MEHCIKKEINNFCPKAKFLENGSSRQSQWQKTIGHMLGIQEEVQTVDRLCFDLWTTSANKKYHAYMIKGIVR